METVFQASSSVEAHMIVHLLDRSDIDAKILGEGLQGGVGELPAQGNIRVVVGHEDAPRARDIIRAWDARQATPSSIELSESANGQYTALIAFFLGAGITAAFLLWAYNSPVSTSTADYNRDGKADEFYYWRSDRLARMEVDRNFDGEIDAKYRYSRRNGAESGEFDNNFDGVFEYQSEFKYGQPVGDEVDVTGDGSPNYRYHYKDGVLEKIDILRSSTQSVKKTLFFENGVKLTEALWDSDNNGSLDTIIQYDEYQEEVSRADRFE